MRCVVRTFVLGALIVAAPTCADDGDAKSLGPLSESLRDVGGAVHAVEPGVASKTASLTGVDESVLRAATLREATFVGHDGAELKARVIVLPAGAPEDSGRAGVVVDAETGDVLSVAGWGTPELDDDIEGYWAAFCSQFKFNGTLGAVINPDEALSLVQIDAIDKSITGGGDAGLIKGVEIRDLYRHRYTMLQNSAFFTRSGVIRQQGRLFNADELRQWRDGLMWVSANAGEFEPMIGPTASATYRELAEPIQEIFAAAIEAAERDDHQGVANATRPLYRSVCQVCHDVTDHPLGERTVYWDFRDAIHEAGVRTDLGIVGLDTWGPTGEERELAQQLANRVRAGLIILGSP